MTVWVGGSQFAGLDGLHRWADPTAKLAPKGSAWGHEAGDIHNILVYVLLGFIGLHVAGALYHYFVLRDRVMQRMLRDS